MNAQWYHVKKSAQLPFYCRPIPLFLAVWTMMLVAFQLRISYTSYPDISLALVIFAASLVSFLLGYGTLRFGYSAVGGVRVEPELYRVDVARLRRFQAVCFAVTVAIMLFNWKRDGLPPIFGFFGADTEIYAEYGLFKQVLFPAFMALLLTAPLEPARPRRWFLYAFGPMCSLAYASRGYSLIMLFQFLIVFSLRSRLGKRRIYLVAVGALCVAVALTNLIGNGRSSYGSAALLGYMQIKRSYYDWPTAYLWVVAYVSSPISNLCWIVRSYRYDHPSAAFLYTLLPGSIGSGASLEAGDLGSENIVDGVHTYIAKYYLDLWWLGVFAINYAWGLLSGYLAEGNRIARHFLASAVALGCLGFIFFADFLTFLIILIELAVLAFGHRYFVVESAPGTPIHPRALLPRRNG
jgi:hypothetical protein